MGKRIIEILLIFFSLAVIIWGISLAVDYMRNTDRDNQRIAMVKRVQNALEEFYRDNNYYPGRPPFNWGVLAWNPEMQSYYNFNDFRDPCQPFDQITVEGGVNCKSKQVAYIYKGIDCETVCKGYKIILKLEAGGEQEFVSNE